MPVEHVLAHVGFARLDDVPLVSEVFTLPDLEVAAGSGQVEKARDWLREFDPRAQIPSENQSLFMILDHAAACHPVTGRWRAALQAAYPFTGVFVLSNAASPLTKARKAREAAVLARRDGRRGKDLKTYTDAAAAAAQQACDLWNTQVAEPINTAIAAVWEERNAR